MNEKTADHFIAVPFSGADKDKIRVEGFSQKPAG
jgi:hypothetical protein